ncbi:transporter [Eubacterium sp. CAG:252]|nr:transporter [Eubacterium sp. CAG:252]
MVIACRCVQERKRFADESVNNGADKPVGKWFVILGKYVLVPLSFIALVAGAILGGIG